MKPIEFPGVNIVFGKGQEQYQPLPALRMPDGQIITCWELTDEEIEVIVKNRKFYINQLTFNRSLQPILPQSELSDGLIIIND